MANIRKPYTRDINMYSPQRSAATGIKSLLPEEYSMRYQGLLPAAKGLTNVELPEPIQQNLYAAPDIMGGGLGDAPAGLVGPTDPAEQAQNAAMMGFTNNPLSSSLALASIPGMLANPVGYAISKGLSFGLKGINDILGDPLGKAKGWAKDQLTSMTDSLGLSDPLAGAEEAAENMANAFDFSNMQGVDLAVDVLSPSDFGASGLSSGDSSMGDLGSAIGASGLGFGTGLGVGEGDSGGGGGGDGGTVLCTELYHQGRIFHYLYEADSRYGRNLPPEMLAGYHIWAKPLARAMSHSWLLTSILEPFIHAWAEEMAYRVGAYKKGNKLGRVLSWVGEPLCGFIGRLLQGKEHNRHKSVNAEYGV